MWRSSLSNRSASCPGTRLAVSVGVRASSPRFRWVLVKEAGENWVDLVGGQQGGAVTEAGQLDVLASGNALGCFPHDPRGEPAVVLECHGQAWGFDVVEPVQVAAVLQPGKVGLVLAEPSGVGPRLGCLDQADGDLDRVVVVLELGHGVQR